MRRSPLSLVFLVVFIDLVGFGIVIPLFPLYAEQHHPSPMVFGLLMSSFSAMQFLFAPLLGRLSDRIGRRPVLLVSLAGSTVGYLLFAFAHTLAGLFVSRIVAGITAANIGTAQAVIADVTEKEDRTRGMGLIGMAFGLGFVLGPAIGGFAVRAGEAVPGLVAAALSACAFLWAFTSLPETRPAGSDRWKGAEAFPLHALATSIGRPLVGPLLIVSFVHTAAFAAFEATFAQFLKRRFSSDPAHVAWLFVVLGITSAAVQGGLVRRLSPRLGEGRMIAAGAILLSAALAGLAVVTRGGPLVGLIVLVALGSGLLNPSLSAYLSRATAASEQGRILGAAQSMSSLGRIVGPFWGENAFFRYGPAGPFGIAAALEVAVTLLSAVALARSVPAAPSAAAEGTDRGR